MASEVDRTKARFECQLCGRGSLLSETEARERAKNVTRAWYADGRATASPATRSALEDMIAAALLSVNPDIATALTVARAETWKEAIAIAKQHCYWGGFQNKQVVEALEAAAGSTEAEDRKAAVIRRGKE